MIIISLDQQMAKASDCHLAPSLERHTTQCKSVMTLKIAVLSTRSRADKLTTIALPQMDFIVFQNPVGICFVNVSAHLLGL
jgi:hypothetical protein